MIWQRTKTALATLAVPIYAGAYVADTPGTAIPDLYLVYILPDMSPAMHADDRETDRSYLMQVSVYSRSGLTNLPDVIGAMTNAGFMFVDGRQLDYDPGTRHFGIAFDFEYLESLT